MRSYERLSLSWGDWAVDPRFCEYAGFQLVTGIYHSALVWEIVETRRSAAFKDWDAHQRFLRRVYSAHRYFASHHKGLPARAYIDLTARKLQITPREVHLALAEARLFGIPELIAAAPEPKANV